MDINLWEAWLNNNESVYTPQQLEELGSTGAYIPVVTINGSNNRTRTQAPKGGLVSVQDLLAQSKGQIVAIPAVINTNIILNNNDIGINIGGYIIGTGSLVLNGNAYIVML
jgi:hypothetical protein